MRYKWPFYANTSFYLCAVIVSVRCKGLSRHGGVLAELNSTESRALLDVNLQTGGNVGLLQGSLTFYTQGINDQDTLLAGGTKYT